MRAPAQPGLAGEGQDGQGAEWGTGGRIFFGGEVRRAARTDANHAEIVAAFRKLGCSVLSLAAMGKGCPDLLVAKHGQSLLVEVKDGAKPPSARTLTPDQEAFRRGWKGGIVVAIGLDDVPEIVREFA